MENTAKKFNAMVRRKGMIKALLLILLLAGVLILYHIITIFGLSYFFTKTDLSLGEAGLGSRYAKAHFTSARMINPGRNGENAVFAVLCPDGRSSFILETAPDYTEKMNKALDKGKTVKVRGFVTALDETKKAEYVPYLKQYGYEPELLRGNVLTMLTFGKYYALHPIINSLTIIILLMILFFILRSLMYGSFGKLKANARKFGYELEDIKKDFESAAKYGGLSIGKKYFYITKGAANAVSANDTVLAYIHHEVENKKDQYSLVLVDKKGREYEIPYSNENKASEALMAISKFAHITTSTTDEYRNKARTSIKTFVESAEERKKELNK